MLTKLEIQNVRSNVLPLTLQDASNGYLVRDIQGLSPVKATLVSSQMAQVDGAQPQSSRRETRNITMKIGFQPNYVLNHDVSSLRMNLYNYLSPKSVVNLYFYLDGSLFAITNGTVESCENNMFSADPEIDVSLICYDPDFYAPASVVVNGNTVSNTANQTISYAGTSPAGIIFTLTANRDLTGFKLYNTKPDNTVQVFDFEGSILNGDIVTITSIPLQKSAVITRNLDASSALYFVQAPSDWIELENGDNDFRAFVAGAAVPFTIEYTPKYGGL